MCWNRMRRYMAVVLSAAMVLGNISVPEKISARAADGKTGIKEVAAVLPAGGMEEPRFYHVDDREAENVPVLDAGHGRARSTAEETIFDRGTGDYGYRSLSSVQQALYDEIALALKTYETTDGDYTEITLPDEKTTYVPFSVPFDASSLSEEEVSQVWIAFGADHPWLFWLENGCAIASDSVMPIVRKSYWGNAADMAEKRAGVKQKIEKEVKGYLKVADYYRVKDDKVREMDAMIIGAVDFADQPDTMDPEEADRAHTIEGVFAGERNTVVSEGYAKSFAFLLNLLDIPNVYVTGTAGDDGKKEFHAWNCVSFDNGVTYSCMDLTWDDLGADNEITGNSYLYFAMPKSKFEQKHQANTSEGTAGNWLYDLPELGNDMNYTYFMQYGAYGTDSNVFTDADVEEFLFRVRGLKPNRENTCAMMIDNQTLAGILRIMQLSSVKFIKAEEYDMKIWANPLNDYNKGNPHPLFSLVSKSLTINLENETEKTLAIGTATNASGNYVRWQSDNNEVAVVKMPAYTKMEKGANVRIVAKKAGKATIYAHGKEGSMTCEVEVTGEKLSPNPTPSLSPNPTPSLSPNPTPSPSPTPPIEEVHKHRLMHHAATPAACETAGTGEYWKCEGTDGCGDMFLDAEGKNQIREIPAGDAALGHVYSSEWMTDESFHWRECIRCHTVSREDEGHHRYENDSDMICDICRYDRTSLDTQPPVGTIKIETNLWMDFLDAITFGLFFKETKQAVIEAQDTGSGVDRIQYHISEERLSEEEVKALPESAWTEGSSFTIRPDTVCVIYARITDRAENVTYLSSDGLVFDGTAPVIRGVTDGEIYRVPQEVTVTDANLESVKVNGREAALTDHAFMLEAVSGAQTILATDKAGNTATLTVTIKTEEENVRDAKRVVEETLEGMAATNDTDRETIQNAVDAALNAAGITCVDASAGELDKVEATVDAEGSIRGSISITCGQESDLVTIRKTIARLPLPTAGKVDKEVTTDGRAPAIQIMATAKELAELILTEAEKEQAAGGTDIHIILDVKDVSDSISSQDKELVEAALAGTAAEGFAIGQYLAISLFKVIGEDRCAISETNGKMIIIINVPESLKNSDSKKTRTYAVLRIHDGKAELLYDSDSSDDTITIETDRFSTYAIVYKDTSISEKDGNGSGPDKVADNDDNNDNDDDNDDYDNRNDDEREDDNSKDGDDSEADSSGGDEPETGDTAPLKIHATLTMIAGFTYLLLYFADRRRGMTEKKKKELVSQIVRWAKRGGRIRKMLAIAVIFVLLVYYHSIGKKTCVEWEEIHAE